MSYQSVAKYVCMVVTVALLTGPTGRADAALINYLGNDNVIYDDVSGTYWYAQMDDFVNMNYGAQIAAIAVLPDLDGIGNWTMASQPDMNSLFPINNSYLQIFTAFAAVGGETDPGNLVQGRYEFFLPPSFRYTAMADVAGTGWLPTNAMTNVHDAYANFDFGAWVTGTPVSGTVPEPSAFVMAVLAFGVTTVVVRWQRAKQARRKNT